MLYADSDGEVDALLKIVENRHTFVRLRYVREDSQPAYYYPDFLVRIGEDIYLVETKAQNQLLQENVVRKQRAATAWVEKINDLPAEKRDSSTWHYVILGDSQFYEWKNRRSSTRDILEFFELKNNDYREQTGRLF
jgi:type III restriction enzyme